jgi:magnesium transporter
MTDLTPDDRIDAATDVEETEVAYGVSPETVQTAREALVARQGHIVRELVAGLHAADVADLLEQLTPEEREQFLAFTREEIEAETLTHLDEDVREEVLEALGPQEVAEAVSELDSDDALDVLEDLDEEAKKGILERVPAEDRVILEQGLTYPEESAGRLMQRTLVAVPAYWTVGETIDFLRASDDLPDDFYDLFIVDPAHKPIGTVPLSRAMRTKRPVRLTEIMETELHTVPVDMDREEVAYMFRQYALVSAPVVDEAGRLVGVVTVDDVVHVIEEETEEDLMGLGGVGESDIHAGPTETSRRRVRWLLVTGLKTLISSFVIWHFEATIERMVALAVLMPIVGGMAGDAGMQVVTVAVRAMATRDLTAANAWRVLGKELAVGAVNGLVFALLLGAMAALWFGDIPLALVLGSAVVFNMVWAGLAGTLIPLGLVRLGVDPAIAAGPFLVTTTDVIGFFSFLGLATVFLL